MFMKLKLSWILTAFMALIIQFSFAQEKTITGNVKGAEDGLPLPGASVLIKGTSKGAQTDFDGNYSIKASQGQVLVFSFIGNKTTERTVGTSSTINVTMEADAESLNAVVVTGFGEKGRKSVTSSIVSPEIAEIKTIATATVSGALQGSVTGLQVNQNGGAPGTAFSVRLRGASSINGSNEPLYVVDGIPIISGDTGGGNFGGQDNDALASLNFSDVESIQVLKDASATAIYGSRAANGVVLITTKRGKAGKVKVEMNTYVGTQNAIRTYEIAKAGEVFKYNDIAWDEAFGFPSGFGLLSQGFILGYDFLTENGFTDINEFYESDFGENYIDAINVENALVASTDISISGGSDKATFFAQFSDFKQDGTILNQSFDRRSLRLNANFNPNEKLAIDAGMTVLESNTSRVNTDNNIFSGISTALLELPGIPLRDDNGVLTLDNFLFSNPLQNVELENSDEKVFRVLANLGLNYSFNDKFNVYSRASIERLDFRQDRFFPAATAQGIGANGDALTYINLFTQYNSTTTLNYNEDFGLDKWDFTALAGFSFEGNLQNNSTLNTQNFPEGLNQTISGATVIQADNFNTERKLFSYFGRLGVDYDDKVFLEGTMRADASSVFGAGNKVGYFPALSAAYLASNDFDSNLVTNLKLRASWGQTGNQSGLGNFASAGLVSGVNFADTPGTSITQIENPNLKWEVTTQTNFGLDFALWDRINISYDYYDKQTEDLLLARPFRNSTGFTTINDNIGSISNKGHELSISADIFRNAGTGFNWTTQLNLSRNVNEVTGLLTDANGDFVPIDAGFATRIAVGQPLGAFFGLQFDGLYRPGDIIPAALQARGVSEGDVKYVDINGDGDITNDDRTFIGDPNPDLIGNWRNTIRYKNFDFSANLQFELGREIYNNTLAFAGPGSNPIFSKLANGIDDYYTEDNTDATQPRPRRGGLQTYNSQDSSQYIENGEYVRLKEATLGYTFTPKTLGIGVSLRVYVGGDNLFTITDYSGNDPEVNTFGSSNVSRGTDFLSQGLNKTYKFGVNLKF